MRIRCVNRPFRDLQAREWRKVGDVWEATPERLAAINRAGYGVMAEEVPAERPQTASAARKQSTAKKGTTARKTTRKTAQEG